MQNLRPLSARSVVLSLLLGAHPARMSARELVAAGELVGIAEPTLRVALTRLVGSGDLDRDAGDYRLSARLLERQRRQDEELAPQTREWTGDWELVVITAAGRSPADRAELRHRLAALRLAELREGVWLRPANLDRPLPSWPTELLSCFTAAPAEPARLAAGLWDLTGWNKRAAALLRDVTTATGAAERLALAAAAVRHLRTDPALPTALLPGDWHAGELRAAYADYQAELFETLSGAGPRTA